jgi:hypothetical protein
MKYLVILGRSLFVWVQGRIGYCVTYMCPYRLEYFIGIFDLQPFKILREQL